MSHSVRALTTMVRELVGAGELAESSGVVAFRWREGEAVPGSVAVGTVEVPVAWAPSELALRVLLAEPGAAGPRVVLTPLEGRQLAEDVRARLLSRQVHELRMLEVLRRRLGAVEVSPALAQDTELQRVLLDEVDDAFLERVPAGVLDREMALAWVVHHLLGGKQAPTPSVLLGVVQRMAQRAAGIPEGVLVGVSERLSLAAGPVGRLVGEWLVRGGGAPGPWVQAVVAEAVDTAGRAGVGGRTLGQAESVLPPWLREEAAAGA
ncbi:MAG: hypothetical protein EA398_15785, partial [Deltaproteobacteria bacterium]